jgi:general secretion pathway protein F
MKSFRYRAYAAGGLIEDGVLEAASRDDAVRLLTKKGSKPFEISEQGTRSASQLQSGRLMPGRRIDLEALFRDLDVLMSAGFDIDAALGAVRSGRRPFEVRALDAALVSLKSGGALTAGFARIPGISEDLLHLLESGESSGKVDQVVAAIAKDLASRRARRNAMIEALVYPSFLMVMMLGAMGIITFYLVPALAPIFEGTPEKTPLILSVLDAVGDFARDNLAALSIIGLGAVASILLIWRSQSSSAAILLMKLPALGPFLRDRAISRYLGAAALLTGNGVPINKALELAVKACPLKALHPPLLKVRTRVVEGGSFVDGLAEARLLDDASLSILGIGEEANRLPQMLERAGYLLERRTAQTVDRALKILTPLITIVMGVLIGGLVISVMTSILSINDLAFE